MPQIEPPLPDPSPTVAGAPAVPRSLLDFHRMFTDDRACAHYLERLRWPKGFVCEYCGVQEEPYRFANRPTVLCCRSCRKDNRLTAGTIMHLTKQPLLTWFWAAYLVTSETPGMSALQFQRQFNIKCYETAFMMLHKLRSGMVRPDRDAIGGEYIIEMDETLIGGRTKGEGRGVHHKATVVGAVEIRESKKVRKRRDKHDRGIPVEGPTYAGRMRLRVVLDRSQESLEPFVMENIRPKTIVRTDGWQGYDNLQELGYEHEPVVTEGSPEATEAWLPMIHIVFGNLKTWLRGTHHGVSQQHLQAYLNEFVFRFNRRFYPMIAFHSAQGIGTQARAPTYDALYRGDWERPNPT
jgi:transposase-like protein